MIAWGEPASLTKADIGDLSYFYGQVNALEFRGHEPGTVRFLTFAGTRNPETGRYDGQFQFCTSKPNDDDPRFDFNERFPEIESCL